MIVRRTFALCASLTLASCGGGDVTSAVIPGPNSPAGPETSSAHRYSGPGSFYAAAINPDGTFTIDISERLGDPVLISVQGTYDRLDSGFLVLTVTAATGPAGQAPVAGDQAYALEVPGFALFLRPMQGGELIPMLIRGACPTADFAANWAMAQTTENRDASHPDREWFGTFQYEHGAVPRASVDGRYSLATLGPLEDAARPLEVGGCQDGLLQVLGDGNVIANMWLTDGGAMVESMDDDGERLQTIFAMRQQPVALADLAGDYATFVLVDGEEGVDLAIASIDAAGLGSGAKLDPVSLEEEEGRMAFALRSPNQPAPGWVTGTIDGSQGLSNLACSTQIGGSGSGRNVMFCIGQDPGEPSRSITLVMVAP